MRRNRVLRFLVAAILATVVVETRLRADEPTANAAVHRALAKRMELKYVGKPLPQVAADLQAKLGIPTCIDSKAIGDAGIAMDTPVTFAISNVSAKAAISLMVASLNLTTVVSRGVLTITTPEQAENMLNARVYDVADLVVTGASDEGQPDFDQLIDIIKSCLLRTTWDDVGGRGLIAPFQATGIRVLMISQTSQGHEKIEDFLAGLRAVRDRKAKTNKGPASSGHNAISASAAIDRRLPRIAETEVAVRQALAKPVSFQFNKTPLGQVVAVLKEKTGVPILVDVQGSSGLLVLDLKSHPRENTDIAVSLDTPVTAEATNVSLEVALKQLLDPWGLTWTYQHECLLITTPERDDQLLITRSYDVSDLPAFRDKNGKGVPNYEAIIDMIQSAVGPTTWKDIGGPGTIAVFDQGGLRTIVISQTWRIHLTVETLLTNLRERRGPPPTNEQIAKLPLLLAPFHPTADKPEEPPTLAPQPDLRRDAIVDANNRFAFDLYKQVGKTQEEQPRGNLFFSPSSIATALAMVHAAARGTTAEEMSKTLHLTMPQEDVAPGVQSLLATLPGANHRGCRLLLANGFWGQQEYQFTNAYLETLRKSFGAELAPVDFAHPEVGRQTINTWVDKKTDGQIKQIVGPDSVHSDVRFALTNAVYFNGQWSHKFQKYATKRALFSGEHKPTETAMMRQMTACRYGIADHIQILEKTFRGQDIAMMILLPDDPQTFSDLEQLLSAAKVKEWSAELKRQTVDVCMPRFQLETSLDLDKSLAAMGMPTVFQSEADLSGMHSDKMPLWLSRVLHRATIHVDEQGTVATAATAAMGTFGGPPPSTPVFRADHPFVFLIRDTHTGNILFVGRLVEPNPAPPEMQKEPLPTRTGGGMGMF